MADFPIFAPQRAVEGVTRVCLDGEPVKTGLFMRAQGFALTPRMEAMGIIGFQLVQGGALAEFAKSEGVQFALPMPVVDYLMAKDVP